MGLGVTQQHGVWGREGRPRLAEQAEREQGIVSGFGLSADPCVRRCLPSDRRLRL